MLTANRIKPSGAYEISALVMDREGAIWRESQVYYGYTKAAAQAMFKEAMAKQEFAILP